MISFIYLLSGIFLFLSATESLAAEKVINFSAEKIEYDRDKDQVTARGAVTLYENDHLLKADMVVFDRAQGTVRASGNIFLRDRDGTVLYLEEATLSDDLKDGFIRNIRVLFDEDSRLIATEGQRKGRHTTFKNAVYSPCKICNKDGRRHPLWQIRAEQLTHDAEDKIIRYKNVVLSIAGVPVFYTPYFSHPDPTVHAASGFLMPAIATSSELGVNVTIPYHFALAPHRDITLEPLLTTRESVVMAGTYRQHTGNGQFFIKGSFINAIDRDIDQIDTGNREIRGHLFSEGQFDLDSLNVIQGDEWQWDYAVRWVSDDTYLRRYYQDRSDVLESHIQLENFVGRSYFTSGLYGFQGLDEEDNSATTGHALPLFNLNIISDPGKWGNQFSIDASGAAIVRTGGLNSRRMSLKGAWKLPLQSDLGDFYTFTASLRGDVFHNSSAEKQTQMVYGGENGSVSRLLPKFAVDWRLPFIRHGENVQQIIEPLLSIVVAPNEDDNPAIANEDSRNFEFDENNLFSHNRYNGYDRWEGGTRVNYGIRYSLYSPVTTMIATLGQSFRLRSSETFPVGSGYEGKSSDLVGRLDLTLGQYIDYVHRFRLDKNSFNLRRNELILSGGPKRIKAMIRYLDLDRDTTDLAGTELEDRKELGTGVTYTVNDQWTLHGNWVRDLLRKTTISYDAGILFKNECLEFGLRYERRLTTDRDITPSSLFHIRLSLKHLG